MKFSAIVAAVLVATGCTPVQIRARTSGEMPLRRQADECSRIVASLCDATRSTETLMVVCVASLSGGSLPVHADLLFAQSGGSLVAPDGESGTFGSTVSLVNGLAIDVSRIEGSWLSGVQYQFSDTPACAQRVQIRLVLESSLGTRDCRLDVVGWEPVTHDCDSE